MTKAIPRRFLMWHYISLCNQFHQDTSSNPQQPLAKWSGITHRSLATSGCQWGGGVTEWSLSLCNWGLNQQTGKIVEAFLFIYHQQTLRNMTLKKYFTSSDRVTHPLFRHTPCIICKYKFNGTSQHVGVLFRCIARPQFPFHVRLSVGRDNDRALRTWLFLKHKQTERHLLCVQ